MYYSPRWKDLLGYQDHELENSFSTWQNNLHPEDKDRMEKAVAEFTQNPKGNFEHEFRMKHKNGSYVWILNKSAISCDSDGLPHYMSGSHLDISSTKEYEQEKILSEKKFKDFFEFSPLGKSITSPDGKMIINKRFSEIVGYTEEEINEKNWKDITVEEDIPGSEKAIEKMLKTNKLVAFKKSYIHKKGHHVWTMVRSVPLFDENGNITYFLTSIEDITKSLEKERQIVESEKMFRQLFHSITIALCFVDENKQLTLLNTQFTKLFGYTKEDIPTEELWFEKAYPEEEYRNWVKDSWLKAYLKAEKENTNIESIDYQVKCKNGAVKTVNIGGFPLRKGFLVTLIDVTERKKTEIQLKESESRFRFLIKSLTIPLCQLDNEGNFLWTNDQFVKKFGYTMDDMSHISQWWVQAYPDENYREWVIQNWNQSVENATAKKTDIKSDEYQVCCKDGSYKTIIIGGLKLEEGFLATFIDITEIKNTQNELKNVNLQLIESNKELEQFAYVASHDLQEPLRKVKNYMELFESKYAESFDDGAKKYLILLQEA